MRIIYIRIEDDIHAKLVEDAKGMGISMNGLIGLLIRQWRDGGFLLTRNPGGRLKITPQGLQYLKEESQKAAKMPKRD